MAAFQPENSPSTLAVHTYQVHPTHLRFQNQSCIGKFRIKKDKTYSTSDAIIPEIIPIFKMQNLPGTYLGTNSRVALLIPEYKEYHELKQDFFLRWIIDNHFFDETSKGKYKRPEFVCFGSCIYLPMITPGITRFGDWEIYAVKILGTIYLWNEKPSGDSLGPSKSMESYYGVYFEHLLTQQNTGLNVPNEFDKVFVVNEITFGSHQLLCLSEIDAQDEKGDWVEIKVYKKCSQLGIEFKYLKFWGQSSVSGVKSLVIGERDASGYLSSIETSTTDELGRRFVWRPGPCYDFEDRLLAWIKSHFRESNARKVKKFSWRAVDMHVHSCDVPEEMIPKPLLPKWYIDALAKQQTK